MSARTMRDRFAQVVRTAEDGQHECVMVTLTLPSSFHPLRQGMPNACYSGATPRDGQEWLRQEWARVRTALERRRLRVYGLRLAEPHHDGMPHWHVVVFAEKTADMCAITSAIRHYWGHGGERGGAEVLHMRSSCALLWVDRHIAKSAGVKTWAAAWGMQLGSSFGVPPAPGAAQ